MRWPFSRGPYSLRKSKHVLRHAAHLYLRKKKTLTPSQQEQIKKALEALQNEILAGNRQRAFECAEQLEVLSGAILKKSPFRDVLPTCGRPMIPVFIFLSLRSKPPT